MSDCTHEWVLNFSAPGTNTVVLECIKCKLLVSPIKWAKYQANTIAQLTAERDALKLGVTAVHQLIDESYGVAGLHLNGDIEPWEGLLAGGRFEEWLGALPPTTDTEVSNDV